MKKKFLMSALTLIVYACLTHVTSAQSLAFLRKANIYVVRDKSGSLSRIADRDTLKEFDHGLFYLNTDIEKEQLIDKIGTYDVYDVYTDGTNEAVETNEILISGATDVMELFDKLNLSDEVTSVDSIWFSDEFVIYKVKCAVPDVRGLCKQINQSGLCKKASPNTAYKIKKGISNAQNVSSNAPNADNFFEYQWALYNPSNQLLDMDVLDAWKLSKGANTKIALLTDGVQLDHPDLKNNLLQGFNVTSENGSFNGESSSVYDVGGTEEAGIIAAEDNNIGIVGVAPEAKIIPIKVAHSTDEYYHKTYTEWMIEAYKIAYENGADIISTSWYHIGDDDDDVFDDVFDYICKYGRNGKGSVIVCTSGAKSPYNKVIYPATSEKDPIVVGAISKDGKRLDHSNYGVGLDVVAPGSDIYTTIGSEYINRTTKYSNVGFVSGVAALMLSFNPDLTYREVQRIINSTATKLPEYTFTNSADHPDGTWNEEVGYGLVNAFEAVKGTMRIEGADVLCDEDVYTLEGMPEGAEVYWSFGESGIFYVFPPLEIIDGQGTAQATFKRKGEYQLYIDESGASHPVLIPYVGTQTIKATVTLNGNSCVLDKEVTMPDPDDQHDMTIKDENVTGQFSRIYWGGDTIPLSLLYPVWGASDDDIVWTCVFEPDPDKTPESLERTITLYGNRIEIPTPVAFSGFVHVTVTKSGECNIGEYVVTVMANIMYIDFTNPANGSVDVSVKEAAAGTQEGVDVMSANAEAYAEPYMGEYRLELWHEVYGMVREMDVEAGNPTVTMDLGGLTPGWYYVRMIADGEMKAVGKLMVR